MSAVGNAGKLNSAFIGAPTPFARFNIRELLASRIHGHERIEVDVGIPGNGLRLLLGDGALRLRGE